MKTLKKKFSVGNVSKLLSGDELKCVTGGYDLGPCWFWCWGTDGEEHAGLIYSFTCYDMDWQCRQAGYHGNSTECEFEPVNAQNCSK